MPFTVFYAWQSDRDQTTCRYFIRKAAQAAIKQVAADAEVKSAPAFDHATQGETGLVHISDTIKRKIRRCGIFLGDLTFVGTYQTHGGKQKWATNANVGIELGYAMRAKNPKQFILVMNTQHGPPEELPFDLRHYSFPIRYTLADGTHRTDSAFKTAQQKLTKDIASALRTVMKADVIGQMGKRAKEQWEKEERQLAERAKQRWRDFHEKFDVEGFRGMGKPTGPTIRFPDEPTPPRRAYVVLSIIPLTPQPKQLDPREIQQNYPTALKPMDCNGWHTETFSNLLTRHNGTKGLAGRKSEPPTAAVEIYEDGSFFAAIFVKVGRENDKLAVVFEHSERLLLNSLVEYVSELRDLGIVGPLEVRVALRGMSKTLIYPANSFDWNIESFRPLTAEAANLRPVVLNEELDKTAIIDAMKPSFERVWMDAGAAYDPCFGRDGKGQI